MLKSLRTKQCLTSRGLHALNHHLLSLRCGPKVGDFMHFFDRFLARNLKIDRASYHILGPHKGPRSGLYLVQKSFHTSMHSRGEGRARKFLGFRVKITDKRGFLAILADYFGIFSIFSDFGRILAVCMYTLTHSNNSCNGKLTFLIHR